MNALYRSELRLMLNYFQPSVKLLERTRVGSRVKRTYDTPKTPFERLIELSALAPEQIAALRAERDRLDPLTLSIAIEAKVAAILCLPVGPVRRAPSPRIRLLLNVEYPLKVVAKNAAYAAAPVRSNAAR